MSSSPSKPDQSAPLQAPPGTRDFYPIELARRRWIEDKWRRVAIRHGFEEIDGPTFEMTDLYTRKSGDGIVGEIFGVYSGKDEAAVKSMGERLAAGQRGAIAPYALRPEFTPTLARMYAARAKQLPQPAKWFWQQNCYRAERPQRGRLREFMQWNCDIIGGGSTDANAKDAEAAKLAEYDAEVIACCVDLLRECGLKPADVRVKLSNRSVAAAILQRLGVAQDKIAIALQLIDRKDKMDGGELELATSGVGFSMRDYVDQSLNVQRGFEAGGSAIGIGPSAIPKEFDSFKTLKSRLLEQAVFEWCDFDLGIARGLAYYTGMVFEVIVDGERAVAGGGRYDNLIETFGGPPTPAVGFGMGDVVLSLVLQDKGLMPTDKQIAADLGLRPDVFVISNGTPESDTQVQPLLASLRRAGMHARRTYKATKNIGKLLKEANDAGARFAVIIENPTECTVKDLDDNKQWDEKVAPGEVAKRIPPPVRR